MKNLEHIKKPEQEEKPTIHQLYQELILLEPKPVATFVPDNAAEQQTAFLAGEIRNPSHVYGKLDALDFNQTYADIARISQEIITHPDLNPKYVDIYQKFADNYTKKTRLLELAQAFNTAEDQASKDRIKAEYMKLNIELYGEPDKETYASLLNEKLNAITSRNYTGRALQIKDELNEYLGDRKEHEEAKRFSPSPETIEWSQEVVSSLYDGLLGHVPEKEVFNKEDVQHIFQTILNEEFGEAAKDWRVDIESAKSINVKSTEKRIIIPDTQRDLEYDKLRSLIVHEIGIHVLRSVMGGETDLDPLKSGLYDYYDAEEGLGVVMEQALAGEYVERGIPAYITAGLIYHDKKDFRDAYEIKWRLNALEQLEDGDDLTEESLEKIRKTAYAQTMRFMRGTDELPWFKDLAYYNGSAHIWKYFEDIRGDDVKFMFTLLGKADPTNAAHEHILLEVKTVG